MAAGSFTTHLDKVLRHAERKLGTKTLDREKPRTDLIKLYQRFLKIEEHRLKLAHRGGESGKSLAQKRSNVISVVLKHIWEGALEVVRNSHVGRDELPMCLVADGGFGRGELCPHSDVDILFLYPGKAKTPPQYVSDVVEQVLYMLWDIGFSVGSHAFSLGEVIAEANSELENKTRLLEARLVAGDREVWQKFNETFEKSCIKGREKAYLEWRMEDQMARHEKYGNTVFLQEPNVKNGCGGLRDYQNLLWMARFAEGASTTAELHAREIITPTEKRMLDQAYDFILRVRNELHYIEGRESDVLTLHLQGRIANNFRYKHRGILRRIEAFMREYYNHAYNIFQLTEVLSLRLSGRRVSMLTASAAAAANGVGSIWSFLPGFSSSTGTTEIDGFLITDGVIEESGKSTFVNDRFRLVRVFQLAQVHKAQILPDLQLKIRRRLQLIDRSFIYHKSVRAMMLSILGRKGEVAPILRAMHSLGVLGKLFPEFAPLNCLVQHEFFHRYTADEHTLVTIEMLDRVVGSDEKPFVKYRRIMSEIDRPAVLYLAMLLHDTGKAANRRHHDEVSAENAVKVARRMKLEAEDLSILVFLVDHHMSMSEVARSKNIDDEETIMEFARLVKTPERLDMLMVLTFADYSGTDTRRTNVDWKEMLLWQLYHNTRAVLTGGEEFLKERTKSMEDLRDRVCEHIKKSIHADEITAHFENLPERYFQNAPEVIASHIEGINQFLIDHLTSDDAALHPQMSWEDFPDRAHSELNIITWDRLSLFTKITGALSSVGLNILRADIFTRTDDIVIDSFAVCNERLEAIDDDRYKKDFEELLTESLSTTDYEFTNVDRLFVNHKLVFEDAEFPTRIRYDQRASTTSTLVDIQTPDRPGLLYRIAQTIAQAKMNIDYARISTEKGAALDAFYLVDDEGNKIKDEERFLDLIDALRKSLEQTPRAPKKGRR